MIQEDLGLTVEQPSSSSSASRSRPPRSARCTGRSLPNGRRVVVKVQRPDAPRQIEADLELLYQAARFARDRVKALAFIDTVALVDEFARTIRQELDYRIEARNAEQFHRNFAGHPRVKVPRVLLVVLARRAS